MLSLWYHWLTASNDCAPHMGLEVALSLLTQRPCCTWKYIFMWDWPIALVLGQSTDAWYSWFNSFSTAKLASLQYMGLANKLYTNVGNFSIRCHSCLQVWKSFAGELSLKLYLVAVALAVAFTLMAEYGFRYTRTDGWSVMYQASNVSMTWIDSASKSQRTVFLATFPVLRLFSFAMMRFAELLLH